MNKAIKKANPRFVGAAWAFFVLAVVTVMFILSFLLTAYVYRLTNLKLPPLAVQVVNSLLGLLFTGLFFGLASRVARARGWAPDMNVFGPIIDAMQKIAKGDFTI